MFEPSHPEFLELVRCPVTQGRLRPLADSLLAEINQKVQAGDLFNRMGRRVERELEAVLVNQDGSLLVPLWDGIVTLIADDLIPTDPLNMDLPSDPVGEKRANQ